MLARSKVRPRPVDVNDLVAAFEHAAAGMAITDEGAVVLHANTALGDLLGYPPESLIGRSVVDLTHPDDLPNSHAQNLRLARGEISNFSIEKRYLHASGRPVWTRVHVSLLTHGGRRHHLLHVVDITHERSSDSLLRESQQRFREMTESVEQDFWLMSLEPMELLYSSPAATRIWGFDPATSEHPKRIFESILPDDFGIFLGLFDGSTTRPKEAEYRIVRGDGTLRWLRTRIFPIADANGVPTRLGGLTEDVTSRKQAELEVAHHREFERLVTELSADFVNLPADGLRQGFERALAALGVLFGADRATIFLMDDRRDLLESRYSWGAEGGAGATFPFTEYSFARGNPLRDQLLRAGVIVCEDVQDLPDFVADQRAKFLANGVRSWVAVPLLRRGQLIGIYGCSNEAPTKWKAETGSRMKIAADLFSGALERVRAVAAIRTHQEALAHALRVGTLGQLAAGLAHELNQPLASILNYAQGFEHRLASGNLDAEQLREGARRISEQALRASDVIATLRTLVRKGKATRSWHDTNELVRTALRFIEHEAVDAGTRLVTEYAADLPLIQVDPIQIEQVVINLVRNAVDAVRGLSDGSRREVRIVTRRRARGSVEVGVIDRGPGIPPTRADAVFDEFHTTKPDGLGLGLSISRSIVEAHGGKLWIERGDGAGATFRFTLAARA